jgi:hypothetical protein
MNVLITVFVCMLFGLTVQLSILSEGVDTRRACLHEISTIVTGLEGSIRDENEGTGTSTTKGQRKLTQLEHSIQAAKQRVRGHMVDMHLDIN